MAHIEVRSLRKSFGTTVAVTGLDLTVRRGEVFGLIGSPGAGKTTVLDVLAGRVRRDAGSVSVLDTDPGTGGRRWRSRIGLVGQSPVDATELTVRAAVRHFGRYVAAPRDTDEVLALTGLTALADAKVRGLSGGARRRVDIALALVGDPELLLLDEPTAGVDHAARPHLLALLRRLADEGITVLLATRHHDVALAVADRWAILEDGRIRSAGRGRSTGSATGRGGAPRLGGSSAPTAMLCRGPVAASS